VRRSAAAVALAALALAAPGCGGSDDTTPAATAGEDGISLEEAQAQPPPPVADLDATAEDGSVRLRWLASPDVRYRVLRGAESDEPAENGVVTVDAPGETEYADDDVEAGATYVYRVVPENLWGLAGEPSPEVTVRTR
jgi:hypothetical protein